MGFSALSLPTTQSTVAEITAFAAENDIDLTGARNKAQKIEIIKEALSG